MWVVSTPALQQDSWSLSEPQSAIQSIALFNTGHQKKQSQWKRVMLVLSFLETLNYLYHLTYFRNAWDLDFAQVGMEAAATTWMSHSSPWPFHKSNFKRWQYWVNLINLLHRETMPSLGKHLKGELQLTYSQGMNPTAHPSTQWHVMTVCSLK